MNWYLDVLKKYTVFDGRARRTEFWMFGLISFVVSLVLSAVDFFLGSGGILGGIYSLAVLLPSIAVGARRLHDTNRSGWWQLIALIPLLGILVLLYFMILDSDSGSNQYGPSPK